MLLASARGGEGGGGGETLLSFNLETATIAEVASKPITRCYNGGGDHCLAS